MTKTPQVTRKQFQEWLNQFPEDTLIEVAIQERAMAYEAYGAVGFYPPKIGEKESTSESGWEFTDYRRFETWDKNSEYFGRCCLQLGERA
jgi:hypothetical protein